MCVRPPSWCLCPSVPTPPLACSPAHTLTPGGVSPAQAAGGNSAPDPLSTGVRTHQPHGTPHTCTHTCTQTMHHTHTHGHTYSTHMHTQTVQRRCMHILAEPPREPWAGKTLPHTRGTGDVGGPSAPAALVSQAGNCRDSLSSGAGTCPACVCCWPHPTGLSLSPYPQCPAPRGRLLRLSHCTAPICGLAGRGLADGRSVGTGPQSGPAASSSGRQQLIGDVSRAERLAPERRDLSSGLWPPRPRRHCLGPTGTKAAFSARCPGNVGEQRRPLRWLFWEAGDNREVEPGRFSGNLGGALRSGQ